MANEDEAVKWKWVVGAVCTVTSLIIGGLITGMTVMLWADRNNAWDAIKTTNASVKSTSDSVAALQITMIKDMATKADMSKIDDKVQRVLDEQRTLRDATITRPAKTLGYQGDNQ